jgi:hypothetical protein
MKHDEYTIRWICALPIERAATVGMLGECHSRLPQNSRDSLNQIWWYTLLALEQASRGALNMISAKRR